MKTLSIAAASALLAVAMAACAQAQPEPVQNIDPAHHGNLSAAQALVREAYDRVSEAQTANHGRLGGHAGRAKELMRQANDEIKLAAVYANGGTPPTTPLTTAPPGVVYMPPTVSPGPDWVWSYHARFGWGWHHPTWGWQRGWY